MSMVAKRAGSSSSKVLIGILGVAVVGSTIAVAQRSDYEFFDPIIDVERTISRMYVDEVDREALQRGAIEGMLDTLEDDYALYVPPQFNEDFNRALTGEYVGIGALVGVRDERLTIVNPLDGSPAAAAGLLAGDVVLEIGGTSTEGLDSDAGVELIKGKPGTSVELLIERDGREMTVEVQRDNIKTRATKGYHRGGEDEWRYLIDSDKNIAYVRLTQFTPDADEELRELLTGLGGDGELGGLVLDLRSNPGGGLVEAVGVSNLFLSEGQIVSTRGRAFEEEVFSASERGTLGDFPIAVLINGQSASASEIVSGAILENGRGIVVGERSFGKGSVQTVRMFGRDRATVKLTTQRYYLPSGRSIQRMPGETVWGVDPSPGFFVTLTDDERRAARDARAAEDLIDGGDEGGGEEPIDWSDTDAALERLSDRQLTVAVRAVQDRVETGRWPRPEGSESGEDIGASVAADELASLARRRERLLRELDRVDDRTAELAAIAAGAEERPEFDLWPDDAAIEGGRLEVFDASGTPVARLSITGDNLERWLIDAGVEPEAEDESGEDENR